MIRTIVKGLTLIAVIAICARVYADRETAKGI